VLVPVEIALLSVVLSKLDAGYDRMTVGLDVEVEDENIFIGVLVPRRDEAMVLVTPSRANE
jgi:hypothetical protein